MRSVLAIIPVSIVLASCGSARAAEPDSGNPAHCVAALNMAAAWNENSKSSKHPEWTSQYRAGALYLIAKINKSGGSLEESKAQAAASTKTYWKDSRMPSFILECVKSLAKDPEFRAQEEHFAAVATAASAK